MNNICYRVWTYRGYDARSYYYYPDAVLRIAPGNAATHYDYAAAEAAWRKKANDAAEAADNGFAAIFAECDADGGVVPETLRVLMIDDNFIPREFVGGYPVLRVLSAGELRDMIAQQRTFAERHQGYSRFPEGDAVNFSYIDFTESIYENPDVPIDILDGVSFANATIDHANFSGLGLNNVSFRRARGDGTVFSGASMNDVDFSNAQLSNVDFRGTWFDIGVKFCNARLYRASFWRVNGDVSFNGADISNSTFADADIGCASTGGITYFSGASLHDVDFIDTTLDGADFSLTNGSGVRFVRCDLRWSDFANNFAGSGIIDLRFIGSDLYGAAFPVQDDFGAQFDDAQIAQMTRCLAAAALRGDNVSEKAKKALQEAAALLNV